MNTMRYLCSLFGASTDDLVTAETPAGLLYREITFRFTVGSFWDTVACTFSFLPIFTERHTEVGKGRLKLQRRWTD